MPARWLALLFALLSAAAYAGDAAMIEMRAGIHLIRAEVADKPATRQRGLMHRTALDKNSGMIFVFEQSSIHCFWMKNTPLPLSIAFIADDGRVTDILDMKPHDESGHCPSEAVRYALEMEQGWFTGKGVKVGSKLKSERLFGK